MTGTGQFERLLASRLNDQSQISYPTFDRTAAIDGNAPKAAAARAVDVRMIAFCESM
jgi:hypothetical protein